MRTRTRDRVQGHDANPFPEHGARGPGHIAFAMAPQQIPEWRKHLEEANIAIEAEVTWPSGGFSLYFRDPAGNSVELATPQVWEG